MKKKLLVIIALFSILGGYSQSDSLVLKNGDVIIGELKTMDRGVAIFKTNYSDSDFKIEWDGITKIYTISSYMITLQDGSRLNGKIKTSGINKVNIILDDTTIKEIDIEDVVFLKSVDNGFWDQVYASVDYGLDLTRAQHLR
jgi:small nuclear ribonucleoprotein (snRNP)-like protein